MSISWYQAIPSLLDIIQSENPQSILEVGIGIGKYGGLTREVLDISKGNYLSDEWEVQIDGIEVYPGYENSVHANFYNNIYKGDILTTIDTLSMYDVILLIDVLEYFTKEDGKKLINKLLEHTKKTVIVSTSIFPNKKEEYIGGIPIEHTSRWSLIDLADYDISYKNIKYDDNGAHIFKIYPNKPQNSYPVDNALVMNELIFEKKTLTVTFYLPHKYLTGGLKMLLYQMIFLKKRGHNIIAAYKSEIKEDVIPDWMDVDVDEQILIPPNKNPIPYLKDADIIIAGWVDQLVELENDSIPIFYWEQGHKQLFGDFQNLFVHEKQIRKKLNENYSKNVAIASVSEYVKDVLRAKYSRNTVVLPNFIDTEFYYPDSKKEFSSSILLVGNPGLQFKGFDIALKVLEVVWSLGYRFSVKWITQIPVNNLNVPFPIELIVKPSQKNLSKYYRDSDLLLFTSWYEGFAMPPLEAMASGIPVVATASGGINTYAENFVNALLFEPGDINGLAAGVIKLLTDYNLREKMSLKGRETAELFSYTNGIYFLEEYLHKTINYYRG